jgi:hypothetical protein
MKAIVVRNLQELIEQTELVHNRQRRRMHCVAAKVAEKVGVFLEDGDVHAGARQQITQHYAGGAAAGDNALGFYRLAAAVTARAA